VVDILKEKNRNFKDLKLMLKHNPRQSFIEIDTILSTVQDKKAFIFLMDAYETEKEITRELIEQLLEYQHSMNNDMISFIELLDPTPSVFRQNIISIFDTKNLKPLIIGAIVVGLLFSITFNESVALKIVDMISSSSQTNLDKKAKEK
jgi:hypothetical protein